MRHASRRLVIYILSAVLLCSIPALSILTFVTAAPLAEAPQDKVQQQPQVTEIAPIVSNETCLSCHGQPGLTMTLLNGDVLDLYVNPKVYAGSIHGQDGYACVQCHTNLGEYPHAPFTATDLRNATLRLTNVCDRCHSGEYNLTMDSVHYDKQAIGIKTAAVCTDCHGSHDVRQWTDPQTHRILPAVRLSIPVTCSKCHNAIYEKYRNSVHGAALSEQNNTDVPTCIDCHGVHNIGNPTTAEFRLNSPLLCAECHTNPTLMEKYGISTNVLNTYVADFHGTTVTLFEKQSPDAQTNKPVCYDCHGVHDISRVDDPQTGIEMQQNLLVRCKVCHPDATSNFPSAWMSHYIPSPNNYSLVYYVNLFYKIFIPLVLGFMVAMVGMDLGHTVIIKSRRRKKPAPTPPTGAQPLAVDKSEQQVHPETGTVTGTDLTAEPHQESPDSSENIEAVADQKPDGPADTGDVGDPGAPDEHTETGEDTSGEVNHG